MTGILNPLRNRASLIAVLALVGLTGGCDDALKTERDALYAANQELRGQLDSSRQALEAAEADRASLVAQLADRQSTPGPAPSTGGRNPFGEIEGVDVTQGAGTITVNVPGDVLFDSGKVDLKASSKSTLGQIAGVIKREYSGRTVRVEGYTDSDPISKSKWTDNLELSSHRAMAVERYLVSQGINKDLVYSAGFGESSPKSTKAKSRRVEIVVITN